MATLKFICPMNMVCSGSTSSGKTSWLYRLLQNKNEVFDRSSGKILYCYGVWQSLYDEMEQTLTSIHIHEGVPNTITIKEFADGRHNIIIIR